MYFSDAFLVLAACYAQPVSGLAGMLDRLCAVDALPDGISRHGIGELKNCFEASDLDELRLDHARLFVGPFALAAPPFGSVYLEGRRTLMGASTQDARKIYREAGLDMAVDFNNPPDHIIAELEFVAYLYSALQSADADAACTLHSLQRRFLQDHLGAWVEPFTRQMEQGAETTFYRLLGGLTREMVRAECPPEAA